MIPLPVWTQWITLVIACIGAVTGSITFWRAFTRDTPRIRVHAFWVVSRKVTETGQVAMITSRRAESVAEFPDGRIGVAAVNADYVSVHISQVGLCPDRKHWFQAFREFKDPRGKLVLHGDADERIALPYKLEPGQRVELTSSTVPTHSDVLKRAGLAYVMTSDDRLFTGGRKMVRAFVKKITAA